MRVYTEETLNMADWDEFLKWVLKEKAYDCLGRSFSKEAVQARLDEQLQKSPRKVPRIPGIGKFQMVKLGYSKL